MSMHEALYLGVVVSAITSVAWSAEPIRIVERGQPKAVVVIPTGCDNQTKMAAELLVRYVRESSGASLPIREGSPPDDFALPVEIHIGATAFGNKLELGRNGLDDDGFVIRSIAPNHLVIAGPTPYGTEFGVCDFLERYLGVRWLQQPGQRRDPQ